MSERRAYDNSKRREQAAGTRDRIVDAGCELLHGSSVRDWRALTVRAVAERAGVNERTIYRHFVNERGLRDAVMHRLEDDAGIDLAGMRLDGVADVATRILEQVASFPLEVPTLDPTLAEANERQRQALLDAVAAQAGDWSPEDRTTAAAVLDVLWSMGALERLVGGWGLEPARAIESLTWAIGLVEQAVRDGKPPSVS